MGFAVFFCLGLYFLWTGHPAEDAYILFIYSEHLADGQGITFFEGGPPLEGATDFLWMVALALLNLFGIDTAVAALILNSVGVGAMSSAMTWGALEKIQAEKLRRLLPLLCALCVSIARMSQASLVGFGTTFYCGVLAIALVLLYQDDARIQKVPFLGLILALIRPDGVLLAAGLCLAALILSSDLKGRVRVFKAIGLCCLVGSAYFGFRYWYFGNLLPLPLYVKSNGQGLLPGARQNIGWMLNMAPVGAGLAWCLRKSPASDRRRILACCIPALLLLVALAFAHQSQNVAQRLQAPASCVLIVLLFFHADVFRRESKRWVVALALFASLVQVARWGQLLHSSLRQAQMQFYIDPFPLIVRGLFDAETKIVLTEAGRLPYWTPGVTLDLVGLNTVHTALHGPSVQYIQGQEPDLLFFHTSLLLKSHGCGERKVCRMQGPRFQATWERDSVLPPPAKMDPSSLAYRASRSGLDFLAKEYEDYHILVVLYASDHSHVYGVKKDGKVNVEEFARALEISFDYTHLSYFGLKRAMKDPNSPLSGNRDLIRRDLAVEPGDSSKTLAR